MAWLAAPLTAPRRPLLVRSRPPAWRYGSLAAQKLRLRTVHLRAGVPSSEGGYFKPGADPATSGAGFESKVPSPASSAEDRAETSSLPPSVTSTADDQQQESVRQSQPHHQQQQQQQQPPSIAKQPGSAAAAGVTWRSLLASAVGKLLTNLWPLLLVHLVSDGLTFGLHRVSHRLTNEAAVRLLGGIGITPAAIGNMWWLSSDPALANFRTGYQFLTIAVFLLAFPLNVLLKATASIYTVFICEGDVGKEVQRPWWQAPGALRAALPLVRGLSVRVGAVWRRALLVELLVAIIVVPLQFTSLAVVTLPFTLPFLLDLQAAGTAAVLEGVGGIAAIKRSRQLIKPIRWKLAVPFVGIVVAQHVMNSAKGFLLGNLPPRYYLELVEIPAAIAVLGTLATLLLTRLQDVLPYTAYREAAALEGANGTGMGGTGGLAAAEQQAQPKPV